MVNPRVLREIVRSYSYVLTWMGAFTLPQSQAHTHTHAHTSFNPHSTQASAPR